MGGSSSLPSALGIAILVFVTQSLIDFAMMKAIVLAMLPFVAVHGRTLRGRANDAAECGTCESCMWSHGVCHQTTEEYCSRWSSNKWCGGASTVTPAPTPAPPEYRLSSVFNPR